MRLIGFSGKMGAGKTTAARHAIEAFGGTKIALADSVKEEVAEFLESACADFEHRHLYGTQEDKNETCTIKIIDWCQTDYRPRRVINKHLELHHDTVSITYRQLLQLWGTEYRRAENPTYWTQKAQEKINRTDGLVFVDDVRFPDEVQMIHDLGGMVVSIARSGIPLSDHPSETALDNYTRFDWVKINSGTLDQFRAETCRMLDIVGLGRVY